MKPTRVSLVVATYRRPILLQDTVLTLKQMTIPEGVHVEVLVIDNDPDGSCQAMAQDLLQHNTDHFTIRYIHEKRKGLSHARNRGIEESRGDIVAFMDDDFFVSPGWLQAILECFERTGADVVGGRTIIYWESEPEELVRRCKDQLTSLDMGERDFPIRGRDLPGGGNAAFRRAIFEEGTRFSTELGRVGNILLSGEDSEMFERLRRDGKSIWYCAGAAVQHRTGGERLTAAYLVRLNYWFGISSALIDQKLHGKRYQLSRAVARAGKAVFLDSPRWLLGLICGNPVQRLLAKWSLAKQVGYVRTTLALVRVVPHTPPSGQGSVSVA